SPLVNVTINGTVIKNTLIDLGAAINVMTNQIMDDLKLKGLRPTTTVLQLVDRSTVNPEGVLEDV
ncbi:hypothetical protein KI387_036096, partial [Taxus chinensis]